MKKSIAGILAILLCLFPVSVFANSAQTYFEGISPTGAIVRGTQSPIVVEKERLTFDLQEFPQEYFADKEKYLAYTGSVTAEYTFSNPSDYDVTVQLAFPFGQTPDYGYSYDWKRETEDFAADAEKYGVLADGTPIESTVRHTLFYRGEEFSAKKDMALLLDGEMQDTFWRMDLPVTKYSWQIDGIDEETYQAARLGFRWSEDGRERKLMLLKQAGGSTNTDEIAVTRWVENGDVIEVLVFGKPLEGDLEWFSENGAEDTPFAYTLAFLGEEEMTYADFVFADYAEDSGILRQDWYNAVTQNLKNCEWERGILGNFEYVGELDMANLLRWYTYEITVPAGGTLVNTVTAPMYPDINMNYEPPIYAYTYLLSPAQTWADFGRLEIVVNTPYDMTERGGAFDFVKTETGYQTTLEGLPEGELTFTLSTEAEPKAPQIGIPLYIKGAVALAASVTIVFLLYPRKKNIR